MINGQAVFKANVYSLEDGEPSVWDKELGATVEHDEVQSSWPRPVQQPNVPQQPKAARAITEKSEAFDARLARRAVHNDAIKADKAVSCIHKQEFIRKNWALLRPFLDESEHPQGSAASTFRSFPALTVQPSCLQNVTMRDYQLEGVNWLINSYANGVNIILGGKCN
jgi:SNF2 family DNA or RNA helicase